MSSLIERSVLLLTVVLPARVIGAAPASLPGIDWAVRLRVEAPEECRRLEEAIGRFEGGLETVRTKATKDRGTATIVARGHYLLNDRVGGALVTVTNPDNDRTTVLGFSREYDFEIHKPAANPLFAIQQYKPVAREGSATAVSRLWDSSTLHPLVAAEDFSGVKLPEFLSGKVGRIVAVNAFDEDGETHVRVEVERTIAADQKVHSGWAVLNPARHWAILKYEQNYGGWLYRQSVAYRDDVPEIAFPRKVFREEVDRRGTVLSTLTCSLEKPQPCAASAERFTLEAYDLKPPGGSPRNRVLMLLLTALAFSMAGIGALIFRIRRRRSRERPVLPVAEVARAP